MPRAMQHVEGRDMEAAHRTNREPSIELGDTEPVDAIEMAADELSTGAGAEETESKRDAPTDREIDEAIAELEDRAREIERGAEIDEAIVELEERAEEISRGDNADIQLEVDPDCCSPSRE